MHPLIPFAISLACAVAAALPAVEGVRRRILGLGTTLSSIAAVMLAAPVLISGVPYAWGPLRIDRFGAYVMCLIAVVATLAALAGVHYLAHGRKEGTVTPAGERTFSVFFPLFVLSMWTAAVADNLALLWIALEATTLSTTLLVAFDGSRGAIEAAWKYIIICSTGITLGLLGVLMLVHSASGADLGAAALTLSSLKAHAGQLSVPALKWAFVFLFIGIGTKVGFVPMHTWLPDAHSKTPSPISAMLSGILLNVAFAVILRAKSIVDAANGSANWSSTILLVFGLASIALPAFIMLVQKNYKRMLAYSSIEHMGLMAFAVGLGPLGVIPAVIHMAGHAFAKPALFVGAGEMLHEYKSTRIEDVQDFIGRRPKSGALFFLALLALLAAPPSALFVSEFLLAGYGMTRHPLLTVVVLTLLVIVAFGMMRSVVGILFARTTRDPALHGHHAPTAEEEPAKTAGPVEEWNLANISILANVLLCLLLGTLLLTGPGLRFFVILSQSL